MRAERLFRSPRFSAETGPKMSCRCRITLHTPPEVRRHLRPEKPAARPFCGKKGAFCPQRPPFCPPSASQNAPFFPGPARFAPRRAPKKPGFCPNPGALAHPGHPAGAEPCGGSRPVPSAAPARHSPPHEKRPVAPKDALFFVRPAVCAPPVAAGHPPWHSRWARQTRLPWSAFPLRRGEVCGPRGDQIPGLDG